MDWNTRQNILWEVSYSDDRRTILPDPINTMTSFAIRSGFFY